MEITIKNIKCCAFFKREKMLKQWIIQISRKSGITIHIHTFGFFYVGCNQRTRVGFIKRTQVLLRAEQVYGE
ncbi:hypothetical protein ETU09_02805 [Apibacter muscae]|uniref:Uncharacterized protein n=1 Tax=Apibacter muscae TaxID=2509004 RepID=A0A563DI39_9FLAO|nr:hypothetical protein [Apibacter muscae]TWP29928.1 hypothetical protein ETU09_02805 [Apibacter muscae]